MSMNWRESNGIYIPFDGDLGGKNQTEIEHASAVDSVGFKRPRTIALSERLFLDYMDNNRQIPSQYDELLLQILEFFGPNAFAVRSSASFEDGALRAPGILETKFVEKQSHKIQLEDRKKLLKKAMGQVFDSIDSADSIAFQRKYEIQNPTMGLSLSDLVIDSEHYYATEPAFAGYVNTMLPNKIMLGIVSGLGTKAVEGDIKTAIYLYDRRNQKLKLVAAPNNSDDNPVTQLRTPFLRSIIERVIQLERALDVEGKKGIDFEFATTSHKPDSVYALQSPFIPKLPQVEFPKESPVLEFEDVLGQGEKIFTEAFFLRYVDCRNDDEQFNYRELSGFNTGHTDYLLVMEHIFNDWVRIKRGGAMPYHASNNAGGIVDYGGMKFWRNTFLSLGHGNLRRVLDGSLYISTTEFDIEWELEKRGYVQREVPFQLIKPIRLVADMENQRAAIYVQ